MPTSGEQGILRYRALQNLFIRPLPTGSRDVAHFPNTYKQIKIVMQNKETELYVPNEEQDKITAKN